MAEVPGAVVVAAAVVVAVAVEKLNPAWAADSGLSERAGLRVEFQAVAGRRAELQAGPEQRLAQAAEH